MIHILISNSTFSQPTLEWERKIDFSRKDNLFDFVTMNDGTFISVGLSLIDDFTNASFNFYYYKFDCNGKIIWQKRLFDYQYDFNGKDIIKVSNIKDNIFAIYGIAYSKKNANTVKQIGFITLVDTSGTVLKTIEFSDTQRISVAKIIPDNRGNMIAALYTQASVGIFQGNKGFNDIWLLRLDLQFNTLQKKNIGGEGHDYVSSIIQSKDGGYILTGATYSQTGDFKAPYASMNFNTPSDAFVLKLDESLEIQWSTAFGGNKDDNATSAIEMPDKSLVIGGMTSSYDGVFAGRNKAFSTDAYVARMSGNGFFSGAKPIGNDRYAGLSVVWFSQLLPIDTSNYLLMCYGKTREGIFNTPNDMTWLLKMNTSNEIIWKKPFGVEKQIGIGLGNLGYQIKKTMDKGYLIVGEAGDSITSRKNSWLLKLSPLEVEKQITCEGLSLYPNPTIGNIKVQSVDYLQTGTEIKVYDVIGRNIYRGITEKVCKDSDIILPHSLTSGMYYLTIDSTKCVLPLVRAN